MSARPLKKALQKSEAILQPKLNHPLSLTKAEIAGGGHLAGVRVQDIAPGIPDNGLHNRVVKLGMVEEVEELRPELHAVPL
jgi:hypothetical protein